MRLTVAHIHGYSGLRSMLGEGTAALMQPFRDYLLASYGETNARAMIQSFVAALTAIIDAGGDIGLSEVGNITCPVLLITGEHDFIAPSVLLTQLAAYIPRRSKSSPRAQGMMFTTATLLGWRKLC